MPPDTQGLAAIAVVAVLAILVAEVLLFRSLAVSLRRAGGRGGDRR